MSIAYINYHRQPRVQFTSISDYNQKFSANVPENEEFETAFHSAWSAARRETDPNEYLQHTFNTEEMGYYRDRARRFYKSMRNRLSRKKKKKEEKQPLQRKNATSGDVTGDAYGEKDEPAIVEPPTQEMKPTQQMKPSLSDFLDDYEEDAHYEEVEAPLNEEQEQSIHDAIDEFIHSQSKDSQQFARDKAHVVHFNTNSDNISERLMKGRDRYMKRLKAYLDGDKTVKIRTMDNKEQLVSDLNPCMDSLRELVESKSGQPRFVKCECECH